MPEVRGPLVTALESPLLIVSAVRAVSQSKPLMLLTPALSAGVANKNKGLAPKPCPFSCRNLLQTFSSRFNGLQSRTANHVEKTSHACQFPIELATRLIAAFTKAGELVVDPFMLIFYSL